MSKRTGLQELFRRKLAEIDPATNRTTWVSLLGTIRAEAAKGDPRFADLLRRAEAFQAEHPEMTGPVTPRIPSG